MRRGNLFWGFFLLIIGGLLLLSTLGLLQNINIWGLIWPTFLILLGARILFRRSFRSSAPRESATVILEGATRARVRLDHGAGRLEVRSGAMPGNLVDGDFGGGVNVEKTRQGDELYTKLAMPSQNFPFFWEPGYSLDWSLKLSREIPITLEIHSGAAESRIDLSDLQVTDVRLETGASATDMTLSANAGATRARIESGAASVTVRIPEGVAARIKSQSGLASVTVNTSRFPRSGDVYLSSDYDTATNKVDLHIETGVGAVDVK